MYYPNIRAIRPSFSRRHQAGEGRLKAIVWTVLLVYGAFAGYKIIPAYVAEYQLADKIQEQARFAVVNHYSEDQVRDNVFKVVQDLDIPVKREEIKILSSTSVVRISMDYTVPVDLLVYHIDLHFTPSSENKSLLSRTLGRRGASTFASALALRVFSSSGSR